MKLGAVWLGFVAVAAMAVGCGQTKPTDKTAAPVPSPETAPPKPGGMSPPAPTTATPPTAIAKSPDFKVAVKDIGAECRKGQAAAESKYKGKVIEMAGKVSSVSKYQGGVLVHFQSEDPMARSTAGAVCELKDVKLLGQLGRGQDVTVTGTFDRVVEGPSLVNCSLVAKGGDTIVRVPAEQLAKEFSLDPQAALTKYRPVTVIVSGTIATLTNNSPFEVVAFKGDGKSVVEGWFIDPELKAYKVGDTFNCVVNELGREADKLALKQCYALPKQ